MVHLFLSERAVVRGLLGTTQSFARLQPRDCNMDNLSCQRCAQKLYQFYSSTLLFEFGSTRSLKSGEDAHHSGRFSGVFNQTPVNNHITSTFFVGTSVDGIVEYVTRHSWHISGNLDLWPGYRRVNNSEPLYASEISWMKL